MLKHNLTVPCRWLDVQRTSASCYIDAIIAWYCSVLTKSIVLYSSSCQFSKNRALQNSIVRTILINRSLPKPIVRAIPINGWSPKAVVPTISILVHDRKSNVQAILINRQPVKTIFRTNPIDRSLRDHLPGQVQLIDSLRDHSYGKFQLLKAPDINYSDNSN